MNTLRRRGRRGRLALLGAAIATMAAVFTTTSLPAFSAATGTVDATVTPTAAACMTLDTTTLNYGTLDFSTASASKLATKSVVITNCGSASISMFARGTDAQNASGSATWTLMGGFGQPCNVGPNQYRLDVAVSGGGASRSLTKVDQDLAATIAAGASAPAINQLMMPCTGSAGAGSAMSWQIVYTATS